MVIDHGQNHISGGEFKFAWNFLITDLTQINEKICIISSTSIDNSYFCFHNRVLVSIF